MLRYEATLVNARLRKAHIHNETDVALIGTAVDLTYPYEHLGESTKILEDINNGTHPYAETLKNAEVIRARILSVGVVDVVYLVTSGPVYEEVAHYRKAQQFSSTYRFHCQRPMVIVGTTALQGPNGAGILKAATSLAEKLQQKDEDGEEWKVLNVLHKYASQVSVIRGP